MLKFVALGLAIIAAPPLQAMAAAGAEQPAAKSTAADATVLARLMSPRVLSGSPQASGCTVYSQE